MERKDKKERELFLRTKSLNSQIEKEKKLENELGDLKVDIEEKKKELKDFISILEGQYEPKDGPNNILIGDELNLFFNYHKNSGSVFDIVISKQIKVKDEANKKNPPGRTKK
jgi:hypothetical protein